MRRALLTTLMAGLAAAALAPAATAAPYDLDFRSCIASDDTGLPCALNPGLRANDVAVSPDGRNVYVVGWEPNIGSGTPMDGRLSIYDRNADGSLTFAGCYSATPGRLCAPALRALTGANAVALSPDGTSLYVAARGNGTAAHPGAVLTFARGENGLTLRGCIGTGTGDGCTGGKAAIGLGAPDDLVVNPSGDRLVVGGRRAFLVNYRRDADGTLGFNGCIGPASPVCTSSTRLGNVTALAFSGDGRDLYAASTPVAGIAEYDAVVHLVATGGALVEVDCTGLPRSGCARTTEHLRLPAGLVVTPDDGELFATAQEPGTVTRFLRGPSGALSEFGCANGFGILGCDRTGIDLLGVEGIAAAPNGSGVYASSAPGYLHTFARRIDKGMTPIRCQYHGFDGCGFGPQQGPSQLAFTPDGANLYLVTNFFGRHLVEIYRRAPGS